MGDECAQIIRLTSIIARDGESDDEGDTRLQAADGRGIDLKSRSVRSRDGHTGARPVGDIGFATLRGGSVVGEHTVIFAGNGERIEFTHRAEDRSLFAQGAVKAALWGRGKKPGVYSMAHVLGLD